MTRAQDSMDLDPTGAGITTEDSWWRRHGALAALASIALVGLALRLWRMQDFWLSADEAQYYRATIGDASAARRMIEGNAHPPLYYWILFGLAALDGSIGFLRLTSLVSGVLCIPAMYSLVRSWSGTLAALVAASLVALSPGALSLSQVMRPYSMQLLFLLLGLTGLARYLDKPRGHWLMLFPGALVVATFLHYSTFVVLAGVAACVCGLALLRRLELARVGALAVAGVPILAAAVWLYLSHIRPNLMGSEIQSNVRETWLSSGFLGSPAEIGGALLDVSDYLFGSPADLALLAAVPIGLYACARRRLWPPVLLVLATLATALLLSFAGQYPLLGSRHCLYLLALLAPPAGIALESLAGSPRRAARWVGAGLALAIAASLVHMPRVLDRKSQSSEVAAGMASVAAVRAELDSERLAGALILTDSATAVHLACMYGVQHGEYPTVANGPVHTLSAGGHVFYLLRNRYRMVVDTGKRGEEGHLETLLTEVERLSETGRIPPLGERFWLVQTGFGQRTQRVMPLTLGDGTFLRSRHIGASALAIVQIDRSAYRRFLAEGG